MTTARLAFRIRQMRLAAGLTQTELALKANMNPRSISTYETKRKRVLVVRLFQIVTACGWTMVEFFDKEDCEPSDAELDLAALRMMAGQS